MHLQTREGHHRRPAGSNNKHSAHRSRFIEFLPDLKSGTSRSTDRKSVFLSLVLFVLLPVSALAGQIATQPSGSGTSTDPYVIASKQNLYWMDTTTTAWGDYYVLTADIGAMGSSWNNGKGWIPIGDSTTPFTGSFDGEGYAISSIYVDTTGNYVGMFGDVSNAAGIDSVNITSVNITGADYVGGLVGYTDDTKITACSVSGTVQGSSYVGGLAGFILNKVHYCYAVGNVSGTGNDVGGLVGIQRGTLATGIDYCFAAGTVRGDTTVGGLCGSAEGIANSFASGPVSGVSIVGGFEGVPGVVASSFSTGSVYASSPGTDSDPALTAGYRLEVGGFSGISIVNSLEGNNWTYRDTQTSGETYDPNAHNGYLTGESTSELQGTLPSGFSSSVWGTGPGLYPYLKWYYPAAPQAISGTAYSDAGRTPDATDSADYKYLISQVDGGSPDTVITGADGYFYFLVDSNTIKSTGSDVIAYTGNGGACINNATGTDTNLVVWNSTLIGPTTASTYSSATSSSIQSQDASIISGATGSNPPLFVSSLSNYGYLVTGSGFSFDEAISGNVYVQMRTANSNVTIDHSLTLSGTNTFAVDSQDSIIFNDGLDVTGGGLVDLKTAGGFSLKDSTSLEFTGGSSSGAELKINDTSYTLLYSMSGLESVNSSSNSYANLDSSYALATSLDASGTSGWIPIGTDGSGTVENSGKGYAGTFDGLDHTISNLTVDNGSNNYAGVFGCLKGTVRDLGITGGSVTGGEYSGGLVGYNKGGSIENVYINVPVRSSGNYAGGVVGYNAGTIANAYSTGAVNGTAYVGGLAGQNDSAATDVYSTGYVGADSLSGGLVGSGSGTVTDGYFDTETSGESSSSGGTGEKTSVLQGTLPTGFGTGYWNTGTELYPYLNWQYSSEPQYITGTIYSDAGKTEAKGSAVSVLVGGSAVGSASSGANGVYYVPVDSGTISGGGSDVLAYTSGTDGGAEIKSETGDVSGLDVWGGMLNRQNVSASTYSADLASDLSSLISSAAGSDSTVSAYLDSLPQGYSTSAPSFSLDEAPSTGGYIITSASGANIAVPNAVTLSKMLVLDAANDVDIDGAITVPGSITLVMGAPDTVYFNSGVNVTAGGSVRLTGAYQLKDSTSLQFTGGSSSGASLTINDSAYTLIYSMNGLQDINNDLNHDYALVTSLDGSGTSSWTPLGSDGASNVTNSGNGFAGVFLGLYHTISNLTVNIGSNNYSGLFGYTSGTVRDLTISGGSVTGGKFVGSLVGLNGGGTITEVKSTSNVDGQTVTGGLVGRNASGTITDSYATGKVDATVSDAPYFGGLIGVNVGEATNSFATGPVKAGISVGGFAGLNESGGSISNCYSAGAVESDSGSGIGGFVGTNKDTIADVYSTGYVDVGNNVTMYGGLIGNVQGTAPALTDGYWNTETSGQSTSAEGTGMKTSQLQGALPSGFTSSVWKTNAGLYPYLSWQYSSTPQKITGTAYADAGVTEAEDTMVTIVVDSLDAGFTESGADGYYYMPVDSGTIRSGGSDILAYTGSGAEVESATGDVTGLDIFSGMLNHDTTSASSYSSGPATDLSTLVAGALGKTGNESVRSFVDSLSQGYVSSASGFSLDVAPSKALYFISAASGQTVTIPDTITISNNLTLDASQDIVINDTVTVPGSVALTLDAADSVFFNDKVEVTGSGSVTLSGNYLFRNGGSLDFTGGSSSGAGLSINDTSYTLLYSMTGLQNINNNPGSAFALATSLDASGVSWEPIGTNGSGGVNNGGQGFTGTFTGLGHAVSDLSVSTDTSYAGLFGWSQGAISDIGVAGGTISGNEYAGGLVGVNHGGTVSNSYSTASVKGNSSVGGLVGSNASGGVITECYSSGSVDTTTAGDNYGGLVGTNAAIVENSYAAGSVDGGIYAGGLVGENTDSITDAYSCGAVTGTGNAGGLVGHNSGGTVADGYWDSQASGQSSSAGGTGLATDKMKASNSYAGFDFTNTWNIVQGNTYLYLRDIGQTQLSIGVVSAVRKLSNSAGQSDEFRLVLRSDATDGLDSLDAVQLANLSSSYLSLSSIVDSTDLSIDSRPVPSAGYLVFQLSAVGINQAAGATDTVSMAVDSLGSGWVVTLVNLSTGAEYNLDSGPAAGITIGTSISKTANYEVVVAPTDMVMAITRSDGWRMYGSPIVSSTFRTILNGIWTQGFSGADTSAGSPNVYTWDESTQKWTVPSSDTSSLRPGEGFIAYVYGDNNPLEAGTQEGFPKTLYFSGTVNKSPQTISLSYSKGPDSTYDGFNLVSNPFATSIDWDEVTRSSTSPTYYVWDPAADEYADYQSGVGGVNGGTNKIAPFQGFWVQATASGAGIGVSSSADTTGGVLYKAGHGNPAHADAVSSIMPHALHGNNGGSYDKTHSKGSDAVTSPVKKQGGKVAAAVIEGTALFKLASSCGESDEVRLVVRPDASAGLDSFDAVHLTPLSASYVSLARVVDSMGLSIDSRPMPDSGKIEMYLSAEMVNQPAGSTDTLSLAEDRLDSDWTVTLVNLKTGAEYSLMKGRVCIDTTTAAAAARRGEALRSGYLRVRNDFTSLQNMETVTAVAPRSERPLSEKELTANWEVIIRANAAGLNSGVEIPKSYALYQNYPNPFNPSTTIRFDLKETSTVTLTVYDILGEEVASWNYGRMNAGRYNKIINMARYASGVYFARIIAQGVDGYRFVAVKKMMMLLK